MSKEIAVQHKELAPDKPQFTVAIQGEALRKKEQALAKAASITQVTNADEQTAAINAAGVLNGLSKAIEATRVAVKQPYWDACQAIDASAKKFVLEINARAKQLETMIGDFQRIERDRALAEQRAEEARKAAAATAAAEEQRRAERAQQEARLAEQRRIEAEQAAAAAKTKAAQEKARKALEAAQAEAAAAEERRQLAEIDASEAKDAALEAANTVVVTLAPAAATGAAIREVVKLEQVTDIEAFYRWDVERRAMAAKSGRNIPSFVKLEVSLRDFNQFINIASDAELDSIPGVILNRKTKASARAVSPQLTLNQ